jgi:hypothetical protein
LQLFFGGLYNQTKQTSLYYEVIFSKNLDIDNAHNDLQKFFFAKINFFFDFSNFFFTFFEKNKEKKA